jgi:DNA polymerase III delta prime subunit
MNESLNIHDNIYKRLEQYITSNKVPNILFYGENGSGKKSIVYSFINKIYNNDADLIKNNTVFANCSQGKGIKFIREELKFFAKMIINNNNGTFFKSIILLNADKLTIDAQSALRRCIELFSHSTRFFLIIEDKYKLLKPILSRFSEIFIPTPIIKNKEVNLYDYNNNIISKKIKYKNNKSVIEDIGKIMNNIKTNEDIVKYSSYFYNNTYSIYDVINYIEKCDETIIETERKVLLLIIIEKIKKEFRSDELLLIFIFTYNIIIIIIQIDFFIFNNRSGYKYF